MKEQKVSVDLRIVSAVLLAALIATLIWARPWSSGTQRTVSVTGEASSKAVPDEYQFSPTYQKKGSDRAAIQQELIATINQVVGKLKELGVSEDNIALQSSTYDNYWNESGQEVTSNTLTITVDSKELSQKVQDYLVTTAPTGQISPYAVFSKSKQKELEKELRSSALVDAKDRADRLADESGAKVGKVVTISDGYSGGIMPLAADVAAGVKEAASYSSLPVLSGKQELTYTVTVVYQLQ